MFIDENKYNSLFITKFSANETQLGSEFRRIVEEYGRTEEIKLKFYETVFDNLISQFKREVTKDENYCYFIATFYNYFINALKEDNVDPIKYELELETFRKNELFNLTVQKTASANNAQEFKIYNLHTKYGRRKARDQAIRNYENGTSEYRKDIDNMKVVAMLIIIAIVIIVIMIKLL